MFLLACINAGTNLTILFVACQATISTIIVTFRRVSFIITPSVTNPVWFMAWFHSCSGCSSFTLTDVTIYLVVIQTAISAIIVTFRNVVYLITPSVTNPVRFRTGTTISTSCSGGCGSSGCSSGGCGRGCCGGGGCSWWCIRTFVFLNAIIKLQR